MSLVAAAALYSDPYFASSTFPAARSTLVSTHPGGSSASMAARIWFTALSEAYIRGISSRKMAATSLLTAIFSLVAVVFAKIALCAIWSMILPALSGDAF